MHRHGDELDYSPTKVKHPTPQAHAESGSKRAVVFTKGHQSSKRQVPGATLTIGGQAKLRSWRSPRTAPCRQTTDSGSRRANHSPSHSIAATPPARSVDGSPRRSLEMPMNRRANRYLSRSPDHRLQTDSRHDWATRPILFSIGKYPMHRTPLTTNATGEVRGG